MILLVLAIASLAAGLCAALAFFWGSCSEQTYHNVLLGGTLSWFVFATLWAGRKQQP
ncbi:MAG: hypothetical protein JNL62_17470 [Bryobacterales bacterium]|nr:hypothetical protein [Bryobacterales bacterium]